MQEQVKNKQKIIEILEMKCEENEKDLSEMKQALVSQQNQNLEIMDFYRQIEELNINLI